MPIIAGLERVCLEEDILLKGKGGKPGLGGIEGTQTKLHFWLTYCQISNSESSHRLQMTALTRVGSASMATVSLNLDRQIKTSWSLTKAGGSSDSERDVISSFDTADRKA